MNKSKVITLRVPIELKSRLECEAKQQGVSLNNLANYLLTTQLSQIEAISALENRLSTKDLSSAKARALQILDKVPGADSLPEWDVII